MSEIKNGGLDQYGTGPFEQQQFGTAGVEGVNYSFRYLHKLHHFRYRISQTTIVLWSSNRRPCITPIQRKI